MVWCDVHGVDSVVSGSGPVGSGLQCVWCSFAGAGCVVCGVVRKVWVAGRGVEVWAIGCVVCRCGL